MTQNDTPRELTARQRVVIDALLSGHTVSSAATFTGVARRTIERWREQPQFAAALRAGGERAIELAAARLAGQSSNAVTALIDVMQTPRQEGAGMRLRAADTLLSHAARLAEVTNVLERIAELEARL